jgi:hypothetical protein
LSEPDEHDDQMVQPEYPPWITNMDVNIDTTILQGIEHTQNKSRVGRNPKHKLPGLHPNIRGRMKYGGESRVRSSHPRSKQGDSTALNQYLMLKPKQLTQLSRETNKNYKTVAEAWKNG